MKERKTIRIVRVLTERGGFILAKLNRRQRKLRVGRKKMEHKNRQRVERWELGESFVWPVLSKWDCKYLVSVFSGLRHYNRYGPTEKLLGGLKYRNRLDADETEENRRIWRFTFAPTLSLFPTQIILLSALTQIDPFLTNSQCKLNQNQHVRPELVQKNINKDISQSLMLQFLL